MDLKKKSLFLIIILFSGCSKVDFSANEFELEKLDSPYCSGDVPLNSEICPDSIAGLNSMYNRTLQSSCLSAPKCSYRCNARSLFVAGKCQVIPVHTCRIAFSYPSDNAVKINWNFSPPLNPAFLDENRSTWECKQNSSLLATGKLTDLVNLNESGLFNAENSLNCKINGFDKLGRSFSCDTNQSMSCRHTFALTESKIKIGWDYNFHDSSLTYLSANNTALSGFPITNITPTKSEIELNMAKYDIKTLLSKIVAEQTTTLTCTASAGSNCPDSFPLYTDGGDRVLRQGQPVNHPVLQDGPNCNCANGLITRNGRCIKSCPIGKVLSEDTQGNSICGSCEPIKLTGISNTPIRMQEKTISTYVIINNKCYYPGFKYLYQKCTGTDLETYRADPSIGWINGPPNQNNYNSDAYKKFTDQYGEELVSEWVPHGQSSYILNVRNKVYGEIRCGGSGSLGNTAVSGGGFNSTPL